MELPPTSASTAACASDRVTNHLRPGLILIGHGRGVVIPLAYWRRLSVERGGHRPISNANEVQRGLPLRTVPRTVRSGNWIVKAGTVHSKCPTRLRWRRNRDVIGRHRAIDAERAAIRIDLNSWWWCSHIFLEVVTRWFVHRAVCNRNDGDFGKARMKTDQDRRSIGLSQVKERSHPLTAKIR